MAFGQTLATLRALISDSIPDSSISNTNIDNWIKLAHQMFPGQFFVDHSDEASITIAASTYEYALPETSSVSTFVAISRVQLETDTAGYFQGDLPYPHMWEIDYDGSGVWTLKLNKNFPLTAGRKLRLVGQRKFVVPAADGDAVELDPGWVSHYALFLGHQSRGGTASDMAAWHQRMAGVFYQSAKDYESRLVNRIHPGSVLVPGVF